MTLVIDTVTWADYETRLRDYLDVPTGHADDLEGLLLVATGKADHWMGNLFEDDDGENTLIGNTLKRVVKGVLDYAHGLYYSTGEASPKPGLSSVKTGDYSAGYAASKVTMISASEFAMSKAKPSWSSFREKVWR